LVVVNPRSQARQFVFGNYAVRKDTRQNALEPLHIGRCRVVVVFLGREFDTQPKQLRTVVFVYEAVGNNPMDHGNHFVEWVAVGKLRVFAKPNRELTQFRVVYLAIGGNALQHALKRVHCTVKPRSAGKVKVFVVVGFVVFVPI
jgi:hypothetical protein